MNNKVSGPANPTKYNEEIKGNATKIVEIKTIIDNVILEGTLNKIRIDEMTGWGMIHARLNDGTGEAVIRMLIHGLSEFREFVKYIEEGKKYRVKGRIHEDLEMIVNEVVKIEEKRRENEK